MMLFAVHLSDFLLSAPWWLSGWVIAGLLLAWSVYRLDDREFAPLALMSAVFFVSSSIHVKLGPTSVHLLLNGLVGMMLGRRSVIAISLGLCLQALLLQHGGLLVMGLNICVLSLPALIVPVCFRRRRTRQQSAFWYGFFVGVATVLVTISLHAAILYLGGIENLAMIAKLGFLAHLPLALIEGAILGSVCQFLQQVKPELLPFRRQR